MIDSFTIFTKGGLILWHYELSPIEGDPISHLLHEVLITERQGLNSYNYQNYQLKWLFSNELDLVFVATVLKIAKNTGIDDILLSTKETFIKVFKSQLQSRDYQLPYKFEPTFNKILDAIDAHKSPAAKKPAQQPQQQPQQPLQPTTLSIPRQSITSVSIESPTSTTSQLQPPSQSGDENTNEDEDDIDDAELQRLLRIKARTEQRKQNQANAKQQQQQAKSPSGKQLTKWGPDTKVSQDQMALLDMSEDTNNNNNATGLENNYGIAQRDVDAAIASHGTAPTLGESYWDTNNNANAHEIQLRRAEEEANQGKGVWGYFQGLIGQKELTKDDLADVSKQFTERLMNKNVAPEIANQLVDSVISGLVGKKLGTFNTMYATIKQSLEESLTRLLTPKRPIDVMTGVLESKAQGRPYSIVFCGVNGVGKSTSLSKIAAFFLAQGLTVGVAACDTFRSGAIEQLKTHCAALKIPLYDKGYGRDEATVAADGILNAKKDGLDVILIDTAGRMQGNDPLMKGLARLMNINNPDLILFVGEALVGNDGCDQLINFNRALRENSGKQHPRLIDGIVLTKFDTIDDKVGTAINMIYSTGQPIVFVGTGQTYRDLKRPNPRLFIDALFG